jgi:hypothetical protein
MVPIVGQEVFSIGFRGLEITASSCGDSGFKSQTLPPKRLLTQASGETCQRRLSSALERRSHRTIDIT